MMEKGKGGERKGKGEKVESAKVSRQGRFIFQNDMSTKQDDRLNVKCDQNH